MSNDPKNTPGSAAEPGKTDAGSSQWYAPPGAVTPPSASTPDQPPLPTNPTPDHTGRWYVPASAVSAASAAAGLNSAAPVMPAPSTPSGSTFSPAPAAATPSTTPAAPVSAVPGADLPGSQLADDVNYDNYVPGVGVVNPSTAAGTSYVSSTPAAPATPVTPTPAPEPAPIPTVVPAASSNAPVFFVPTASATPPAAQPVQPAQAQTAAPRVEIVPPSATESLTQKYTDVEQSVHILRRRYTSGLMSADQLRAELRKLMILDNDGRWWMIGMETDRWYKFNGQDWLLDTPPGRTPLPADLVNVMKPTAAATPVAPAASTYNPTMPLVDNSVPSPTQTVTIPLDEYGMPLAPAEAAAAGTPITQSLPLSVPVTDPYATMVGQSAPYLDNTLGSSSTSPLTVVNPALQQDQYSAAPIDGYQPADSVPAAGPIIHQQPDYGERPGGLVAQRSRLGYYLGLAAVVIFFVTLAATLVVLGIAFLGYYNVVNQYDSAIANLPTKAASTFKSVHIMDAGGNMIAEINDPSGGGRRVQVTIGQISPYLIHATVSTEDQRFYQDPGFDVFGIARAVIQNTLAGGTISGASTITQQLARLMVFDPTQIGSATQRKLTEIVVASEISRRYSKDQILEMYLNQIPYGNYSYGIEAAAESYFGVHAKDLNLPQSAMLAGLPQSPATYDPVQNRQAAFARMDNVLGLMANTGCLPITDPHTGQQPLCITSADVNAAAAQKAMVEAANYVPPATNYLHPHFVNYVLQQLEATYGNTIYDAGFNVYTTLDPKLQQAAETAVTAQVSQLATRHVTNGAALVIRPSDGAVLAMVGSANFNNKDISGQVNIVLAPRQAGSSLKPFVYLTSFTPGPDGAFMTPATILWDVPNSCFPVTSPPYCPTNYDNTFHGPVSARTALANSYNVPAVKTFQYDTVDRFKVIADQVGLKFPLTSPDTAGLSTALGSTEVRMSDLVSAYATLANQGRRLSGLYSIQRITTGTAGQETEVYNAKDHPIALSQVADPGLTYLVTNILSDNNARLPAFGAGNPLQLANGQPAAVKTGTTSDYRDNWTVGYTPSVVVGVWVGNADGSPMINVSGVTGAGPIWNQIMSAATAGKPIQPFVVPANVGQTTICADFGTAAFTGCQKTGNEVFVTTQPPPTIDKMLQQYQIDQFSGLIANDQYCPSFKQTKTFLTLSDTAALTWLNSDPAGQKWAQTHGLTLPLSSPPTAQCDATTQPPVVKITSPAPNQAVYSLVQITGTVSVPNFSYYQLELSQASNPNAVAALGDAIHTARPGDNQYLGGWDTTSVPDGQYNLRIRFYDSAGHNAVVQVPITVNNTNPPTQATAIALPTTIGSSGQALPAVPPTSTPFGPPTIRALFPTAVH